MIIHFAKTLPWGTKTQFGAKIVLHFIENGIIKKMGMLNGFKPKLHTIRQDKSNRWKAGKTIHYMQWAGLPYKSKNEQICPPAPCTGTQKIEIKYNKGGGVNVFIDDKLFYYQYETECGLELDKESKEKMLDLAQNDGFETIADFFRWFNTDFEGKIIHWTDLKY